jgi:hypothetical protein
VIFIFAFRRYGFFESEKASCKLIYIYDKEDVPDKEGVNKELSTYSPTIYESYCKYIL